MDQSVTHPHAALPAIPRIIAGSDGILTIAREAPDQLAAVLASGRDHYGERIMAVGDRLSRRWLDRNGNPYLSEIDALAR